MQTAIVEAYLPPSNSSATLVPGIVAMFKAVRSLAPGLSDGDAPPAFNLRSLTRALQYTAHAAAAHGIQRALYDGLCMCFVTMLDAEGTAKVLAMIQEHVFGGQKVPVLKVGAGAAVQTRGSGRYVNIEVRHGELSMVQLQLDAMLLIAPCVSTRCGVGNARIQQRLSPLQLRLVHCFCHAVQTCHRAKFVWPGRLYSCAPGACHVQTVWRVAGLLDRMWPRAPAV